MGSYAAYHRKLLLKILFVEFLEQDLILFAFFL